MTKILDLESLVSFKEGTSPLYDTAGDEIVPRDPALMESWIRLTERAKQLAEFAGQMSRCEGPQFDAASEVQYALEPLVFSTDPEENPAWRRIANAQAHVRSEQAVRLLDDADRVLAKALSKLNAMDDEEGAAKVISLRIVTDSLIIDLRKLIPLFRSVIDSANRDPLYLATNGISPKRAGMESGSDNERASAKRLDDVEYAVLLALYGKRHSKLERAKVLVELDKQQRADTPTSEKAISSILLRLKDAGYAHVPTRKPVSITDLGEKYVQARMRQERSGDS